MVLLAQQLEMWRVFADRGAVTEKLSLSADFHGPPEPGCADLSGVRILVVEDSTDLGMAMKSLLEASGAQVAGPVATAAEADRLIAGSVPDAALVDLHLQAGERADALIGRLHDRGVRVVVTSGDSSELQAPEKTAAVLTKPFSEAELFAALAPVSAAAVRPN
jgi:CheY-like chemotaxis protein